MNKEFKKYQHLERFSTSEVEHIELGDCYVFPKIDGTNASVWLSDGEVQAGSRNRHLTLEKDNAGFLAWAREQANIKRYLNANPTHRLFGEWLVPHALKTYRDDAWNKFYVFDVVIDLEEELISGEKFKYLRYDEYKENLELFGVDYLPYIAKIKNGSYEQFINQMVHNVFLIQDGKGGGEGIVLKQYGYQNKYGRTTWAKIVTSEFKEKHAKVHGGHEVKGAKMVEQEIVNKYITNALCEKTLAKIENDGGFNSRQIPRLLNTVYHDLVREESWNFVKEFKSPTINFKTLQHFAFIKVKECLPKIF
jgi:hypothetical protein